MSRYVKTKEKIRQEAVDWQLDYDNHNYSYMELAIWNDYFTTQGKRYGLLTEFRENGIC